MDTRVDTICRSAQRSEGLSEKTIAGWRTAYARLRRYLAAGAERDFLGGDLEGQVKLLSQWIGWLRDGGANHTSVSSYWRALHAVLARIAREDHMVDPTSFLEAPRPGRPSPRFLPRASLEEVFEFVRNYQWRGGEFEKLRNVAVLAVMALGGCRLGEVLRLKVGDVRQDDLAILIRRSKGKDGGKHRTVYMAPALAHVLAEYLAAREKRHLTTGSLFVSVLHDKPMAYMTIRRLCSVVSKRKGIHISPHMLRHTCATLLRQAGVADRLAMEQLGHSSLIALQRYSHVVNGELRNEVAKVDVDIGV